MKLRQFILPILVLLAIALACGSNKNTSVTDSLVHSYYKEMNAGNFPAINNMLDDSIGMFEGSMQIMKGIPTYYANFFQWDSVFHPKYVIHEAEQVDSNTIVVTIEKSCKRINFLMDTPLIYKKEFTLAGGKIIAITTRDYVESDWDTWQGRRDVLVSWIKSNHPELDGFIFDQSLQGAENYVKAIEYYEGRLN